MRVSYKWLQDYVEIPWSVEDLADRLTMAGVLVEALEPMGVGLDDIVVGQVLTVDRHPAAEQLYVTRVQVGAEQLQIVTGAANVTPGALVPVARPGAKLPGGRVIQRVELRGVASEGMLCSEAELGTGDDAGGIWLLPPDVRHGQRLVDALGLDDVILHLEVYPNRPDWLSVIGIAREVAALAGTTVRLPQAPIAELAEGAQAMASVHVEAEDLCPRYQARVLRDVQVGPSPAWLQQRLRAAGMRSINNVVDVTNFVMWEWGQPLHAFDYDRLRGGRIVVRRAQAGETLVTLDGTERRLTPDMLVIADAERPVALAGVMGGADSEVTANTTRILLEAATFHPVSVRRTAKALGMRTEASHRFEKGLDPNTVALAAARAASLMQQLAGAKVYAGAVDVYPRPVAPWSVTCRPARVRRLLGADIGDEQIRGYLVALGFGVERAQQDGETAFRVTVPTYRRDVQREADLVEEVARLYGYDRVPTTVPGNVREPGGQQRPLPFLDKVRDILTSFGLHECITYSFIDPASFDKLQLAADDPRRRAVPLRNPLREDQSVLRTTLVGGLLETAARNVAHRVTDVHLFEIGAVFLPKGLPVAELPDEPRRIGLLMTGAAPERWWGDKRPSVSFYELKGVVEQLLERLGVRAEFVPSNEPFLHPGRQAAVRAGEAVLGVLGEVHPLTAAAFELEGRRVYVAELDAEALERLSRAQVRFVPLPRYPSVQRDIALLVPKALPAAVVEDAIRRYGGELVESVRLFDVYEGPQVAADHRSLAYSLRLRAKDRTLTDEEANAVMARIEEGLASELGVRRRV